MKATPLDIEHDLFLRLREKYFYKHENVLCVSAGEYVLTQNHENHRLYMVSSGLLAGYLDNDEGEKLEVFRCEQNMFVGFYSFFSKSFMAYADVIAIEDSCLQYIDYEKLDNIQYRTLLEDFVPVILHELSVRQLLAKHNMDEKESALKRLYERAKLETLGQLASGLAHELNNAIGVMNGNSEWMAKEISAYIEQNEKNDVFTIFRTALENGQTITSTDLREKKKAIEKKTDLSPSIARRLALLGFDEKQCAELKSAGDIKNQSEHLYYFWEMGVALHDMQVAAKHAVHVLSSIKQLSVHDREREDICINETIQKALTLLKKVIGKINVKYSPSKPLTLTASAGELVQIWINLIKNACESLNNAETSKPLITIEVSDTEHDILVKISDNGPGIPQNLADKIFQPNFTTKKDGLTFGLGLGLSIVQKLTESYNGSIEVCSKPGETIFTVRFPKN